ncbi:MAG: hypothetical protein A2Y34_07125 [Spirochaetes bacterium GWC1_27_15]|nr:MAG: hypothetical protein A2Y34_07125 [Spirochaetes bacterium GWC1_27_15]
MECRACGFTRGEEDFIRIFSDHKFKIDNPNECHHGDYDYESQVIVELYACPKCKSVLMN